MNLAFVTPFPLSVNVFVQMRALVAVTVTVDIAGSIKVPCVLYRNSCYACLSRIHFCLCIHRRNGYIHYNGLQLLCHCSKRSNNNHNCCPINLANAVIVAVVVVDVGFSVFCVPAPKILIIDNGSVVNASIFKSVFSTISFVACASSEFMDLLRSRSVVCRNCRRRLIISFLFV